MIITGSRDNPNMPNGADGSVSSTAHLLMLLSPMLIREMADATRPKPTKSILNPRWRSTEANSLLRMKAQAARTASSANG